MITALARPDLPARWPAVVRVELERRQQQLAALARGAVLDLGSPDGRHVLAAVLRLGGAPVPGGKPRADTSRREVVLDDHLSAYDTVVSVGGFTRFADLPAALAAVDRVLAPGGTLFATEPVGRPGLVGLLSNSAGMVLPPARGAHLARDLVSALRDTGFVVLDCERFTMPTAAWPLRPFVQVRARRRAELDVGG